MREVASLMVACLLAGGCTTAKEPFPGKEAAHVWSALVTVAAQPDAALAGGEDRWVITHNDLWVDEEGRRIEIARTQSRRVHRPLSPSIRQDRFWRLRVELVEEEGVPTATFICRDWSIPAHVWDEAARYFDDVWATLGGRPSPPEAAPEPEMPLDEPAPPPSEEADTHEPPPADSEPAVDVDALEPEEP